MRNARAFVDDYRRKGYPDDRIRIIASMRPEPLRSEALKILDAEAQGTIKADDGPPAGQTDAGPTTSEQAAMKADQVTAVFEPVKTPPAPTEPSQPTPPPDVEVLRQEVAAARSERDQLAADLQKTYAELTRARADLMRLNSDNAELPALRNRVSDLETALDAMEGLLTEKDRALSDKEAALAEERAEREAAGGRIEELAATVAEQSARVRELEALHQQLTGADAELNELRAAAVHLKQGVQAKCDHIAELEADVSKTRDEAGALREQVESNEKAVATLQEKLTSRESELASLRSHFDREAADLKKRADQEMWTLRRRLRRLQKGALAGGLVAAGFLVLLALRPFSEPSVPSFSPRQTGALATHMPQTGPATSPAQILPQPLRPPNNVASLPLTPRPEAPKTISWSVPKVEEPPRSNVPPGPGSAVPPQNAKAPAPPATLVIPPASAPKPAAASKVITYTVKKGENLWVISEKVLGRGELWREIARANKISEIHPDVHEGMTLTITVPASN